LGHYNQIDVKFKKAKYSGKRYFYKEFDEDYDEAATRYRQVLTDYPDSISCGVYDEYIDLQREGKYRIGVIATEDDKLIDGYLEAKLPDSDVSICSEFHFTDPIQIRVGLKNCLAQMSVAAEEKQFDVVQFYEVYETDCAHYTFCI